MKITKQSRRDAKQLLRSCVDNGVLDEGKVRRAVNAVLTAKPRGYAATLSVFQRLLKLEIQKRTATVESAAALDARLEGNIRQSLTSLYGPGLNFVFSVNPGLVGGVRIKVGSDVYDGSIHARLIGLQESFSA